jgi:hypothetical protein
MLQDRLPSEPAKDIDLRRVLGAIIDVVGDERGAVVGFKCPGALRATKAILRQAQHKERKIWHCRAQRHQPIVN